MASLIDDGRLIFQQGIPKGIPKFSLSDFVRRQQSPEQMERVRRAQQRLFGQSKLSKDAIAQIITDEGIRNTTYVDTLGNRTVGIGFNLERGDARKKIEALGVNFNDLVNKKVSLTDEQIAKLFKQDLRTAKKDAIQFVGEGVFRKLSPQRQGVLANLALQLGANKLGGFRDFRSAIIGGDFNTARDELIDSNLFKQTPKRTLRRANEIFPPTPVKQLRGK